MDAPLVRSKREDRVTAARRSATRYALAAGVAFLSGCAALYVGPWDSSFGDKGGPFVVSVAFAGLAMACAARAIRDGAIAKSTPTVVGGIAALVVSYAMAGFGLLAMLFSTFQFTRGRQLRRFGRVLLPKVVPGASWAAPKATLASVAALDTATRSAIARQWRENGRTEHASVAAFARLTLDLMALGAPPELIARANEDGLDEIRHAQACFALARAIDGSAEGPAPFAEAARARTLPALRPLALAALAVDSLVDGALHEGVSARIIAKLARRAGDPAIARLLKEIAHDEGRHARHGWDVVKWCLEEGGDAVASALEGAIRHLPREMKSPMPEPARDGAWETYGLMGEDLEAAEYVAGRADLIARTTTLLEARLTRGAA